MSLKIYDTYLLLLLIFATVLLLVTSNGAGSDSCILTDGDHSGPELKVSKRLRIGAFNIKQFGHAKMSRGHDVVDLLAKILTRYDLVLVQEILDSSYPGKRAIDQLLCYINSITTNGKPYAVVLSERVGKRTSPSKRGSAHKEQYAIIYRSDRFQVRQSFHYEDGDEETFEDEFMREPFVVHFNLESVKLKDVIIVGLHTRPADTPEELRNLSAVHQTLRTKFPNIQDIIIMGDLNADCNYASKAVLDELRRDFLPQYVWLIDDEVDTTVKTTTDCAYDRILVTGARLLEALPSSGKGEVFRFDEELSMPPNIDAYKDVSDHYPVEVSLNVG